MKRPQNSDEQKGPIQVRSNPVAQSTFSTYSSLRGTVLTHLTQKTGQTFEPTPGVLAPAMRMSLGAHDLIKLEEKGEVRVEKWEPKKEMLADIKRRKKKIQTILFAIFVVAALMVVSIVLYITG